MCYLGPGIGRVLPADIAGLIMAAATFRTITIHSQDNQIHFFFFAQSCQKNIYISTIFCVSVYLKIVAI